MEKSESMCTHAECPQSWWEFSFEAAVHVYNRTPIRQTNWTTPFRNIYGNKPDVQYFKTFGCLTWVYKPKETRKNKLDNRSEPMTFIGYEIGSKAYKFMRKNTLIFIATHAWFDEEKFPRAKSKDGSSKNKLKLCPPDINQDQEDINNSTYPNSDTGSDHNHDNPHDSSSDNTPSDMQEESQSEEEHFESADSEDEVKSDLKPKTESSDNEKSSANHSRRSSIHSSNEKSKEGSSHGDKPDQGLESDSDNPFKESEAEVPEPGPSLPRRSSRVPKPLIKYGSAYGNKPVVQIEREMKSDKAWQKAVEPKAKTMIKQAHNTFHDVDMNCSLKTEFPPRLWTLSMHAHTFRFFQNGVIKTFCSSILLMNMGSTCLSDYSF